MKRCPKCGYTVVDDDYCRVCNTCVIYEENVAQVTKENFNKYMFLYHVRKIIFPIVCLVLVLIFITLTGGDKVPLYIVAVVINIISLFVGVFEDQLIQYHLKYTKTREQSVFIAKRAKILIGILAVGIAVMTCFIR